MKRIIWLEALGMSDENVGKWSYVCSNHFQNTARISGVRILKVIAVPEKFKYVFAIRYTAKKIVQILFPLLCCFY